MGLAEMQRSLAKLYTDAPLRERFLADPLAVGRELGLTEGEAGQLAQMSGAQLRTFAASLHNKRLTEAGKLLPLTKGVTGPRFAEMFRRFSETHTPAGTKKHLGDALAFAEFVEREVAADERPGPPWLLDLVRYEKARLKAADPRRRVVACFFRHRIGQLVRSLARRTDRPSAVPEPTLALWLRPRRHTNVRYVAYPLPGIFRRL